MRISARNRLKGTVVEVQPGAVNTVVKVDVGGGAVVTSMITDEAVKELGVEKGASVYVVVKASDVMLAADR
jgi:molybdopterin-binding protein